MMRVKLFTANADQRVPARRLAPEEARIFEDHYITCDRCARIVEETNPVITAMRRVAERKGK